ncbi:flippase-like domain-containing protein [Blastococcus sp. CT_GayMR16]|uniref:lysylphosphatidylglycerol synthase transmembrane domain-containing protein n=1 Tax=Blastococcus sp. CT_GayMR16 TaxID=2559607 RepID=UPI001074717D|nr:flippase-like domain-containing protein [Blastococcus sp. CT_GayMR16]TFV91071.1 UPF0104 family protein [Blastococcus sp. CT_GayMR16]
MTGQEAGKRRVTPHRAIRLALGLGALALGVHLVAAQVAGLTETGERLAAARWWLPVLVLLLEAASLLAYGELVMAVLRRTRTHAPRALIQRCVVVGLALGRTLPAGNAAAMAVTVAALRRAGTEPVAATTGLATSGLLSSIVLAGLLPIGVVLTWTTGRLSGIAVSAAVAAGALLVAAALIPVATRRPAAVGARAANLTASVARGPLRRLDPVAVGEAVRLGVEGVRDLARDRRTVSKGAAWAAANWLLDAAVVVSLALTIGHGTPLAPILLAYIVAQLAAAIPLTPGGVGIVETAMIGFLVTAGAPAAAATTTVLGWRLISHWLPILVGLALLPTLRVGSRIRRHRGDTRNAR